MLLGSVTRVLGRVYPAPDRGPARTSYSVECLEQRFICTRMRRVVVQTLHTLVAHFLRVRFPICLACNKVDDPRAASHLTNIRASCPNECVVPVSAVAELALLRSRRRGELAYVDGAGATTPNQGCEVRAHTSDTHTRTHTHTHTRWAKSPTKEP